MTPEQIVTNLVRTSPVELKPDPVIRQKTNGPTIIMCVVGCIPCKHRFINLSFPEGQEATWESDAQNKLKEHVERFHS